MMSEKAFTVGIESVDGAKVHWSNNKTYVSLLRGSPYSINLANNYVTKCDAVIYMNGEQIGTWRIAPSTNVVIGRLPETNQRLTYQGTEVTIEVVFKPALVLPQFSRRIMEDSATSTLLNDTQIEWEMVRKDTVVLVTEDRYAHSNSIVPVNTLSRLSPSRTVAPTRGPSRSRPYEMLVEEEVIAFPSRSYQR